MPENRSLTVAELVFRLADFEGHEPVHYGDAGPVCSAERIPNLGGPESVVILSASPPREQQAAQVSAFAPRSWWRRIVRGTAEAVFGLADTRITQRKGSACDR